MVPLGLKETKEVDFTLPLKVNFGDTLQNEELTEITSISDLFKEVEVIYVQIIFCFMCPKTEITMCLKLNHQLFGLLRISN